MNAQIFADFGEKLSALNLHAMSGGYVMNAQIFAEFGENVSALNLHVKISAKN